MCAIPVHFHRSNMMIRFGIGLLLVLFCIAIVAIFPIKFFISKLSIEFVQLLSLQWFHFQTNDKKNGLFLTLKQSARLFSCLAHNDRPNDKESVEIKTEFYMIWTCRPHGIVLCWLQIQIQIGVMYMHWNLFIYSTQTLFIEIGSNQ